MVDWQQDNPTVGGSTNTWGTELNAVMDEVRGAVDNLESAQTNMVESVDVTDIVQLTQAAYDALGTPDASTLYVIVG